MLDGQLRALIDGRCRNRRRFHKVDCFRLRFRWTIDTEPVRLSFSPDRSLRRFNGALPQPLIARVQRRVGTDVDRRRFNRRRNHRSELCLVAVIAGERKIIFGLIDNDFRHAGSSRRWLRRIRLRGRWQIFDGYFINRRLPEFLGRLRVMNNLFRCERSFIRRLIRRPVVSLPQFIRRLHQLRFNVVARW